MGSDLMEKNLIESDFYKLPKWLFDIKGLQPSDILIYCIAYSHRSLSKKNDKVDEEGRIYFYLTHEGLKKKLGLGRNQIIGSLKRLKQCGAIVVGKKINGKATEYFLETNKARIWFDITSLKRVTSLKKGSAQIQTRPVPETRPDQSEKGIAYQSEKSHLNKNEYIKNEVTNNDKVRIGLLRANITPLLKDKLMEYIDYRERIGKKIDDYEAIKLIIGQIGNAFRNEQHLIDSINESFMYGYQGIFPAKLKRIQPANMMESNALRRLRMLSGGKDE